MKLHPESLLHLSLVRQMLEDERVPKLARAVDARWGYERVIPVVVTGFNPYAGAIYHARRSAFARWLADPAGSARDHNEADVLMREVFFAAHDYVHIWTTKLIQELVPERRFGLGRLDARDVETATFLHLLTETAATAGFDYWYLATFDVNERVPIGTDQGTLSTSYREAERDEYRRANPSFEVQTPAFFVDLARFYMTGEWLGFDVTDLRRSPKTWRWLRHELAYGATQRRYVRRWMRYLATGEVLRDHHQNDALPVALTEPWQERLLVDISHALWAKIKEGVDVSFTRQPGVEPWSAPARGLRDFRFTNLNALAEPPEDVRTGPMGDENAGYLAYQQLSRHEYEAFDLDLLRLVVELINRRSFAALPRLCRDLPRVEAGADEQLDLLMLN